LAATLALNQGGSTAGTWSQAEITALLTGLGTWSQAEITALLTGFRKGVIV